ncbi:hypothetical protein T484DRAFT_3628437, partial [Baffinella frigidus]
MRSGGTLGVLGCVAWLAVFTAAVFSSVVIQLDGCYHVSYPATESVSSSTGGFDNVFFFYSPMKLTAVSLLALPDPSSPLRNRPLPSSTLPSTPLPSSPLRTPPYPFSPPLLATPPQPSPPPLPIPPLPSFLTRSGDVSGESVYVSLFAVFLAILLVVAVAISRQPRWGAAPGPLKGPRGNLLFRGSVSSGPGRLPEWMPVNHGIFLWAFLAMFLRGYFCSPCVRTRAPSGFNVSSLRGGHSIFFMGAPLFRSTTFHGEHLGLMWNIRGRRQLTGNTTVDGEHSATVDGDNLGSAPLCGAAAVDRGPVIRQGGGGKPSRRARIAWELGLDCDPRTSSDAEVFEMLGGHSSVNAHSGSARRVIDEKLASMSARVRAVTGANFMSRLQEHAGFGVSRNEVEWSAWLDGIVMSPAPCLPPPVSTGRLAGDVTDSVGDPPFRSGDHVDYRGRWMPARVSATPSGGLVHIRDSDTGASEEVQLPDVWQLEGDGSAAFAPGDAVLYRDNRWVPALVASVATTADGLVCVRDSATSDLQYVKSCDVRNL